MAVERGAKVSYTLLQRVSNLLICSRCFRRNVHQPLVQVFSRHHRPLPLCPACSGRLSSGHTARVISFETHACMGASGDTAAD